LLLDCVVYCAHHNILFRGGAFFSGQGVFVEVVYLPIFLDIWFSLMLICCLWSARMTNICSYWLLTSATMNRCLLLLDMKTLLTPAVCTYKHDVLNEC